MNQDNPTAFPSRRERIFLILFFTLVVLFGAMVVKRTAFLSRKMGDLDCFLRGAWSARVGADLYGTMDDNDWHYNYPPLLAILLSPLADPPKGVDRTGMIPFWVSATIWYIFSVACVALACHWLAGGLERHSEDSRVRTQPRGCRRWWGLRLWPVLFCLAPIGHSWMRGQVNPLLLAAFAAALALLLRRRRWASGLCLAGAICVKVIPAFLVLFPLWRRDFRCLWGCIVGLFVGLLAVPVLDLGLQGTVACYQEYAEVFLKPALGIGTDESRAKEITEMTATDSQSLLSAIHNTLYPNRETRPAHADPGVRCAHLVLAGLMTALTLWAGRRSLGAIDIVLFFGSLLLVMALSSPVCHLHYFAFALPLVMGLLAAAWEGKESLQLGIGLKILLTFNMVANFLPHIPGLEFLRDVGLTTFAALVLWTTGIVTLWRRSASQEPGTGVVEAATRFAA